MDVALINTMFPLYSWIKVLKTIGIVTLLRKNLDNVRGSSIKIKYGTEELNNFGMDRELFFALISEISLG